MKLEPLVGGAVVHIEVGEGRHLLTVERTDADAARFIPTLYTVTLCDWPQMVTFRLVEEDATLLAERHWRPGLLCGVPLSLDDKDRDLLCAALELLGVTYWQDKELT